MYDEIINIQKKKKIAMNYNGACSVEKLSRTFDQLFKA